jgi:hypothetical protein
MSKIEHSKIDNIHFKIEENTDFKIEECYLPGAIISNIEAKDSSLKSSTLIGSEIDSVKIENADFSELKLRGSRIKKSSFKFTSFVNADLRCNLFQDVDFTGVDFTGAILTNSTFINCNFTDAFLAGAECIVGQFINCIFQPASTNFLSHPMISAIAMQVAETEEEKAWACYIGYAIEKCEDWSNNPMPKAIEKKIVTALANSVHINDPINEKVYKYFKEIANGIK